MPEETSKALAKNAGPLAGGGVLGALIVYLVSAMAPGTHQAPANVTAPLNAIAAEQKLLRQEMGHIKEHFDKSLSSEIEVWGLKLQAAVTRIEHLEARTNQP